jgi:hypothetical protein
MYIYVTWRMNTSRDDVKQRFTRATTGGRGVQTGRDQGKPNRTIVWPAITCSAAISITTLPHSRDESTTTHSQYRNQLFRHSLSEIFTHDSISKYAHRCGLIRPSTLYCLTPSDNLLNSNRKRQAFWQTKLHLELFLALVRYTTVTDAIRQTSLNAPTQPIPARLLQERVPVTMSAG